MKPRKTNSSKVMLSSKVDFAPFRHSVLDMQPAPYLIRGNPVIIMVPGFRRDDVWIPASAGMTVLGLLTRE